MFGLGVEPGRLPGDGFLLDLAVMARHQLSASPATRASKVAIVLLDEASLDSGDLPPLPRALLAPVWGGLLEMLLEANARLVAFDLLFSYSGNAFRAGHDTPLLRALASHRERVVLARSATSVPHPSFLAALRFEESSLGLADFVPDPDGVVRRVRTSFADESGRSLATLVGAVLARTYPGELPGEILIVPEQGLETIPVYSLADVLRCGRNQPELLQHAVEGRIVFVGGGLREEDTMQSSDRFLPRVRGDAAPLGTCGLRHLGAADENSRMVSGVFLHAAAAEAVASGDVTRLVSRPTVGVFSGLTAAAGIALGFSMAPWLGAVLAVLATFALWLNEVAWLSFGFWLPAGLPIIALLVSGISANSLRYLIEERRRRRVQYAFGHYLSPEIVDRLVDEQRDLSLGGELHDVTILFADLTGFTSASELFKAKELVSITNRYFDLIVPEVEATGGYIDKFIGDAVMAIWGAPLKEVDHAEKAVLSALRISENVQSVKEAAEAAGEFGFGIKIGIHSGTASVGNIGAQRRYNYTAIGRTVNVAASLEALPGIYCSNILLSENTAALVEDRFLLCEIDWFLPKGMSQPLRIFEPITEVALATEEERRYVTSYGEHLKQYRSRRFEEAQAGWLQLQRPARVASPDPGKGPARVMAARSAYCLSNPPSQDWDGRLVLDVM